MIKILFLIDTLKGGGAEKVLRNLVNHMDQTKFDITVQTVEKEEPEKYLVPGIHYKSIDFCKTSIGKKLFSYWYRICTELRWTYPLYVKGDYDIEVAYLECGATKVLAGSTNKKATKLAWVHCNLEKKEGFLETVDKIRKQYQKYDKVVCVSEDTKKSFENIFGNQPEAVVLHNVIDEEEIIQKSKEFEIEKEKTKVLTAIGRLTWQKGYENLITVCAKLRDAGCHFKLRILGEGEERENLERLIEQYQLKEMVELLGFVNNPYPYIKGTDFIVCSSRYEGFSTVVVESLILGKTVITTPCSGMKEILGDSEYGVIAEDSSNGLYEAIVKAVSSEEVKENYKDAAKKRGEDFNKKKLVKNTEKFFLEQIKQLN